MFQHHTKMSVFACLLMVVLFIFHCAPPLAAEYTALGLQKDGQASFVIDAKSKTAFIVDLGKSGDGDQIKFKDKLLMAHLAEELKVEHLVFTCSHPHADHMGGIDALFKNPKHHFFKDEDLAQPRFKSITVIDDGVPNSLAKQYLAFGESKSRGEIKFTHVSVTDKKGIQRNAFEAISHLQQEVQIQNIIYERKSNAGPHGRSVITMISLNNGQHRIVDFDDADSDAIASAMKQLDKMKINKIHTFIAPHHGSKFHDIRPILAKSPKQVIISVNPRNRYGHPSAPTLHALIEKLGAENVIFTGSIDNVVLDENGVKHARHTAAMRDSYPLFVADARAYAEKRQKASKEKSTELALFDDIYKTMNNGPPDDFLPDGPGPYSPRPHSPSGGSGAGGTYEIFQSEITYKGSILPAGFEAAYVSPGGIESSELAKNRIFPTSGASVQQSVNYTNSLEPLQEANRLSYMQRGQHANSFILRYESPIGLESAVIPPNETQGLQPPTLGAGKSKLVHPSITTHVPPGGLVYLDGGKVVISGARVDLIGATVTKCNKKICLQTDKMAFELPFADIELFQEVWRSVASGVDSFYLSINPKKKFLEQDSFEKSIPSDRLLFGISPPPIGVARNDVVTAGGIEHSKIGQILWNADVAFKSAALGFDVFTGGKKHYDEPSIALSNNEEQFGEDLVGDANGRWCRLYWLSSSPRFDFNASMRKVTVTGDAVLAKAEAMRLVSGSLQDYPKGTWCEREKRIATSMQKVANNGGGSTALQQLRDLALMQSFAKWAKANQISSTELAFTAPSNKSFTVPKWTSGIRTAPVTLVQEELTKSSEGIGHYVHVFANDAAVFTNCVYPQWGAIKEEWPQIGIHKNKDGIWMWTEATKPKLDKWLSNFAAKIATCGKGTLKPIAKTIALDIEGEERRGVIGITPHVLSSQIHGGVLLGSAKQIRPFESAYANDATVWTPDKKLIVKLIGQELHFWNVSDINEGSTNIAQHIMVTDGVISDSYVKEGFLRFVVTTKPGAIVRKELRAAPNKRFGAGIEGIEAFHATNGTNILQKAVWPCEQRNEQSPICIDVSDSSIAAIFTAFNDTKARKPMLDTTQIDESTWLIELDLTRLQIFISDEWNKGNKADISQNLAIAQKFAQWGFAAKAQEILASTVDSLSPDAQDTILFDHISGGDESKKAFIYSLYAYFEITKMALLSDQVKNHKLTSEQALTKLKKLNGTLDRFPPEIATELLAAMESVCEKLAETSSSLDSKMQNKILDARSQYAHQFAVKSALTQGLHKPSLTP